MWLPWQFAQVWCFCAFARVVGFGAFNTDCVLVAVCGGMSMCLAAIALYGGFVGFIFLLVNLDVFDKTGLIDIN